MTQTKRAAPERTMFSREMQKDIVDKFTELANSLKRIRSVTHAVEEAFEEWTAKHAEEEKRK